jgi:HSP20 family protein
VARIFLEHGAGDEDIKRWLTWLDGDPHADGVPGECCPPMDVLETAATVEITIDLPGVTAEGLKVACTQGFLVVVGLKAPVRCAHREAAFHRAERSFGRFARAVRLTGAVDVGRASATLKAGELRVVLPRIEERRGRELRILVTGA